MIYKDVCIENIGYELAPNVVASAEIEDRLTPLYDRLKLPKGRLELMSGIVERRFWDKGERPSSVATRAGRKALELSGLGADKIGAFFHASVCRDFLEPATASVGHHGIGLAPNTLIYDISNACLGVLDGMVTLANMIELGQIEAGMVVAGEMGEALVEATIESLNADLTLTRKSVKPSFASLTIGSGAVAVILTNNSLSTTGHRFVGGVARCDTSSADLCTSDTDRGFADGPPPLMSTDSEELLRAGCALAAQTWDDFLVELEWTEADINRCFTHQVGVAHQRLLYESIGVSLDKDFATLPFLGNIGSVSLPITLAIGAERSVLQPGDKAALLGIGSGLNCMMLGIEY